MRCTPLFAVPVALGMALGGGRVYANDLALDSARYLRHSAAAKGVAESMCISELDARYFVRRLCARPGRFCDADTAADTADADADAAIAAGAAAAATS